MARPLTGLMPIAAGVSVGLPAGALGMSAVTEGPERLTTAMFCVPLLATSAILRVLSTATLTGALATAQGLDNAPSDPVQSEAVSTVDVAGLRIVMSFEPWLATTAWPVPELMAMATGEEPTAAVEGVAPARGG